MRSVEPIEAARVVGHRIVLLESLVAGLVVLVAMLVLSPDDAGLRRAGPHLAWVAVFLLAARYGPRGLCLSLPLSIAIVSATAAVLGQLPALGRRLDGSADLAALVAAVLVAWVASTHEGRRGDMARQLDVAKSRSRADRKTAGDMQDALVALRSRSDRMNLSLTFLRNVAERLERRDPEEATTAALTLAMTCLDARAGVVEVTGPVPPHLLSWVGPWNGDGSAPVLAGDRVIAAARETRRLVTADEVENAGPGDADMAAPLLDQHGEPFGVLALRGLPYRGAGMVALQDLSVTSTWLATVLSQPSRPAAADALVTAGNVEDVAPYFELSVSPDLDARYGRVIEVQS